jgi:cytochrome c oxidase assembly factor CtaG
MAAEPERFGRVSEGPTRCLRLWLALSGLVLLVAALAPPFAGLARHDDWAGALQFTTFVVLVPMLVVLGAPWRLMGLGHATTALAEARRRHPEPFRSMTVAIVAAAAAIAWRTPPAVDLLAKHPWASIVEAVTLVAAGTALWLEFVVSPPLFPRSSRPVRIALATVTMWVIWVLAYALGMSRSDWYPAYHHIAGHGLSLIADQEIAAGLMWAVTACCLIPLNIWILMDWLRGEEDPDEEMTRLVREERRRAS